MGKIISYKHGEGSVKGLDPRLWDIAQASIAAMPYDAQIRSAAERGKGDKGNHSGGYAIDVTFFDQNGNRIPDTGKTGGVNSAVIYEQWAKTARAIQQEKYPELNKTFRWGGGFKQGYPFDFMHLDITPGRNGAMAYYNWDTGWNSAAYSALPGLKEASGKPVPPLGLNNEVFPVTASRQIDQRRMQFDAALQNTPLPRPRPDAPVAQTFQPGMMGRGQPSTAGAPVPATMSPALASARQRLAAARETRTTTDPVKPPVQGLRLPVAPAPAQTRDDARMAVKAPSTGTAAPAAGRPGGATAPPATNTKIDFPRAAPVAAAAPEPKTARMSTGTLIEIGKTYTLSGGRLGVGAVDENGVGIVRPIDPGVLKEGSGKTIAGGMVRQGIADALKSGGQAAGESAARLIPDAVQGGVSAVSSVGNFVQKNVGSLLSDVMSPKPAATTTKPANTLAAPKATNALLPAINDTRAAQQQAATLKPITTTIRNPEYDAWVAKYGSTQAQMIDKTGQVTTEMGPASGRGGLRNALTTGNAGLTALTGAAPPPPAPPKMITVTKPGNTLVAPVPVSRPAAPQTFKGAGGRKTYTVGQTYIGSTGIHYVAQPNGTFQKVGTPTTNTLKPAVKSATSTTPAPSGSSSTTSWGQSKTASDGTSWAANW